MSLLSIPISVNDNLTHPLIRPQQWEPSLIPPSHSCPTSCPLVNPISSTLFQIDKKCPFPPLPLQPPGSKPTSSGLLQQPLPTLPPPSYYLFSQYPVIFLIICFNRSFLSTNSFNGSQAHSRGRKKGRKWGGGKGRKRKDFLQKASPGPRGS